MNWIVVAVSVLGYWLIVAVVWLIMPRRKAEPPETVTQVPEKKMQLTFEESFSLVRVAAVLLGPPLVFILLWLAL